ncbi:MAG: GntR family transcriptional regulator, arabinose operon transcriptional repressor [Clostridiales bacterium]|nr:GntR family transcriptional regulator, arabinose operon transcriptional repressor [Clostridiales bacterium]
MENQNGRLKYFILMEDIKEEIRSGKIRPGEKLPSENQLSERYEVSRHTVRKALSILENEGFILAEQGKGTFCADTVMTRGNTKIIAVVTTYLSNYIFPRLIRGMDEVLTKRGYSLILKNTKNSRALEIEALEDLKKKNVDGIIIEPSKSQIYSRHLEIYNQFEACHIPIVFIHSTYPQFKEKPCVEMDDEKGAYLLTKYLIDLGHKHLAGIFKTDDSQGFRRHIGFVKALNDHKLVYDPEKVIWYHTEDKYLKPKAEIMDMIDKGNTFDGIVCYNDQIAFEVLEALRARGMKVPRDVSITGFDNTRKVDEDGIGITSIEHPKERLGQMAAEYMLELLEGKQSKEHTIKRKIEPELVIKNSCRDRRE